MKNTNVMAKRIMDDVRASGAKMDTMDDMYAVVSNYVKLTKEQFVDSYNQVKEEMNSELSDLELDMVVGGGVGEFFQDHWKEILIASGIVLLTAATFAGVAIGMAACCSATATAAAESATAGMAYLYGADVAVAAATEVTAGSFVSAGVVGGVVGAGLGCGGAAALFI